MGRARVHHLRAHDDQAVAERQLNELGVDEGPGGKAVIPARATAKLSIRLVPRQRPERVEQLVRDRIARLASPAVRRCITTAPGALPVDRCRATIRQ